MGNFDIERKTLKPKSKRNQIYNIIAGKDKDNYFKDASRTFLYIKKIFEHLFNICFKIYYTPKITCIISLHIDLSYELTYIFKGKKCI